MRETEYLRKYLDSRCQRLWFARFPPFAEIPVRGVITYMGGEPYLAIFQNKAQTSGGRLEQGGRRPSSLTPQSDLAVSDAVDF